MRYVTLESMTDEVFGKVGSGKRDAMERRLKEDNMLNASLKKLRYMIKDDYTFFETNKDTLFKKYPNRFVVIVGQKVKADFGSFEEAYQYALANFTEGMFLVDQCRGEIKPQVFHTRVKFA